MSKESQDLQRFENMVLPHLTSCYNLAHWIMGNPQDAEDMVQEAALRAYQYFAGFQGGNTRAWLLTIVRNTCYTALRQQRGQGVFVELDEELAEGERPSSSPELSLQQRTDHRMVRRALENLPTEYRELIVLRELEGLSYKEIAGVAGIPLGTVMSRLARARKQLRACLVHLSAEEYPHGL